jgi:hypothetical protein
MLHPPPWSWAGDLPDRRKLFDGLSVTLTSSGIYVRSATDTALLTVRGICLSLCPDKPKVELEVEKKRVANEVGAIIIAVLALASKSGGRGFNPSPGMEFSTKDI